MPTVAQQVGLYILDESGEPRPAITVSEWFAWMKSADRQVRLQEIDGLGTVSTIFMGIDHDFLRLGPPLLFESRSIEGPAEEEMVIRSATRGEAIAARTVLVDRLLALRPS